MGFADSYLQKHATPDVYIGEKPSRNLKGIITIPAYRESGLNNCLDSLFMMDPVPHDLEIIVFINLPENCPAEEKEEHSRIYREVLDAAANNQNSSIRCHVIMKMLPEKFFGAGLARKLVMDEAIRRFNEIDNPSGILLSLDADTLVEKNYIASVIEFYNKSPGTEGCAIHFEHPIEGVDFPPEIYNAIINYELHLRYYLAATRYTRYPYAFHTIGSAFAVKASAYCKHGGMSRRKAGEDFYFIQKVAMNGHFKECKNTTVYPSPRPSDRVPFGTGPAIIKQLQHPEKEFTTYDPDLFVWLKQFYDRIPEFYRSDEPEDCLEGLHNTLTGYLVESGFREIMDEIRANVSGPDTFRHRFFRNFNWLWLLKYLHYAEGKGVRNIPVSTAIQRFFKITVQEIDVSNKKILLKQLRSMAKEGDHAFKTE